MENAAGAPDALGYHHWSVLLFVLLVLLPDVATLLRRDGKGLLIPEDGNIHGGAARADGGGLDDRGSRGRSADCPVWTSNPYPKAICHRRFSIGDIHSAPDSAAIGGRGTGYGDAITRWHWLCRCELLGAHAGRVATVNDRQSGRMPEHRSECRRHLRTPAHWVSSRKNEEFPGFHRVCGLFAADRRSRVPVSRARAGCRCAPRGVSGVNRWGKGRQI